MSESVRPHKRQPTRLPRPWDSPGKNTGVGCHFLLQCMRVKSESEVSQSCPTQRPHGLQPTRLLRPWDFPGESTGVGCHCLLQVHLYCYKWYYFIIYGWVIFHCTFCTTSSLSFQDRHVYSFDARQWINFCCTAAAATSKSLQSCPTLCSPIDGSCCTNGRQKRSSLALSLAQSCSCSLARSLMGEICSKYLKSIHSVKTQGHVSATGVHLQ